MQEKLNHSIGFLDPENMVVDTIIMFLSVIVTELCLILHLRLMAEDDVIHVEKN